MKRDKRYHAAKRRARGLNGTRYGPLIRILVCVALFAGAAGLFYHVLLPLAARVNNVSPEVSCFLKETTPAPTAAPTPTPAPGSGHALYSADLATVQKEIVAGEFQYMADPSVSGDQVVVAAGNYSASSGAAAFTRILIRDASTGANTTYIVPQRYETLRYPQLCGEYLVYVDCHIYGGGRIVSYHIPSGSFRVLKTVYVGIPCLVTDGSLAVWIERTGEVRDKIFCCDVETGESVTVAILDNSAFGESMPDIGGNMITYVDASGALRMLDISTSETRTLQTGFVHDPKTNGAYVAYLDGNHSPEASLYLFSIAAPDPTRIASGVVDFFMGDTFLTYSADEKNYVYFFADGTTFCVTREKEKAMLLGAGDDMLVWMDVTWRDKDIMEYMHVTEF